MSLNKAEQRQTGEDLRAYLAASGLQRAELADWLRLDSDELDAVLERTGGGLPGQRVARARCP